MKVTAYCKKCDEHKKVETIFIGKDGNFNAGLECRHSIHYKFVEAQN